MRSPYRAFAFILAASLVACGGSSLPGRANRGGDGAGSTPTTAPTVTPTLAPRAQCQGSAPFDAMIVNLDASAIRQNGYAVANYVRYYCINRIFLGISSSDVTLLEKRDPATVANLQAMFASADVYMLTGQLKWLDAPQSIPDVAQALAQTVGPAYPQFKGIVYDIEPQAYAQWTSDKQGAIARYFQLLATLFGGTKPAVFGQTILTTAPYYANEPDATGDASPTMLQSLESVPHVDGTLMLAYAAPPATQLRHAASALAQLRKPFWFGASTDPSGGALSYYGSSADTFEADMRTLYAQAQTSNAAIAGVAVEAWNTDANSLQTILPQPP